MSGAIKSIQPLGFPWVTQDPFLFCVHHVDAYPKGNDQLGPNASLAGRNMGNDFVVKDGFRMYHGMTVPGFPAHPHSGFETVTIARKGLIDHSDSLGAAGRFGNGDVQWMTAGKGVQHSEMFPLLNKEAENPFELFQIWLNLPSFKKSAEPHFAMLWSETIPTIEYQDEQGKSTIIDVVAGHLGHASAPSPAPDSWAAISENEVAIWTIKMEADAKWTLPKALHSVNRSLYFFIGDSITIDGQLIDHHQAIELNVDQDVIIQNGEEPTELLLLQGKPISEPVVQYGPFVQNTQADMQRTMQEYQRTQFGGWPWSSSDHVHAKERGRFARYADGREEVKD